MNPWLTPRIFFYICIEPANTMKKIESILIHGGSEFNSTKAVTTPIYQTSTYKSSENLEEYLEAATTPKHPEFYHRHGNPVGSQVAEILAKLEHTEDCLVTSTGMSAISTAILAVVKAGDHIIAQNAHYSAAKNFITQFLPDFGVEFTLVDSDDVENFRKVIKSNTRLIYLETPSNPNLGIVDLENIAKIAKENSIFTLIDNTFASPINQNPVLFGIDAVVHSATKYLGGHSDLTAGAICGSKTFITSCWRRLLGLGGSLAPFDSWLLLRGLRTLSLRVEKINENALVLAQYLENHPNIEKVQYCGLSSHPQYELAKKQMKGFTGMLTLEVKGNSEKEKFENAQSVLNHLELFINATSLGGVESLVVHPSTMWGVQNLPEEQKKLGINNGMIRVSVGIEHFEDLMADFESALKATFKIK